VTIIFNSAKQGTPDWLEARYGVITASRFNDALDVTAKGLPSAKQLNYALTETILINTMSQTKVGDRDNAVLKHTTTSTNQRICMRATTWLTHMGINAVAEIT
jgi:hypothetical protein